MYLCHHFFFIQIHHVQYMPFQYNSWYKSIVIILLCPCPHDDHPNWLDLPVFYFHIQYIYMYLYKGDLASRKSTFFSKVNSLTCIHRISRKEWHLELHVVSSMWLIFSFYLPSMVIWIKSGIWSSCLKATLTHSSLITWPHQMQS